MTKEKAIELLRSVDVSTDIDKLRIYVEQLYINEPKISYDKFKSAVEAISDGNCTIKLVETIDAGVDKDIDWRRYLVGFIDKRYYPEYWS